jgi:hypothetical protein
MAEGPGYGVKNLPASLSSRCEKPARNIREISAKKARKEREKPALKENIISNINKMHVEKKILLSKWEKSGKSPGNSSLFGYLTN